MQPSTVTVSNQSNILPTQGTVISEPFIDKLTLTVSIPSDQQMTVHQNILEFLNTASFVKTRPSGPYKQARTLYLETSTEKVHFNFLPRIPSVADCRIEFNPNKVGEEGINELDQRLLGVFPDGWSTVVAHSKVTRIDISVDLSPLGMDQFLFLVPKGIWRQAWTADGRLQTLAHGKRRSSQWLIYDKTAEQKTKGVIMKSNVVRLERVLRNTNKSLGQLKDLSNPFDALVFRELMPPCPPWEDPENWLTFQDRVLVRGVNGALARLPPNKSTQYRKYLKEQSCPWWQPGLIWEKWPSLIASVL